MKLLSVLLIPILLYASAAIGQATPGVIQITGDSIQSYTITAATLATLQHITINAKGHDEKMHRYEGVLLADILTKARVPSGESAKKSTATSYVLVKAADSYTCLFALAEIDALFTDKTIILADKQDGAALPQSIGPFQIIVPGEKKHARWIRQVTAIKVVAVH